MTVFVVERFLAGWPEARIAELVGTLDGSTEAQREHGVRHLRSIFIPDDETCLCLFEAVDVARLVELNRLLGLPVGRIVVGEDHPAHPAVAVRPTQ